MEQEIDLRPYLEALWRGWHWPVAAGLVLAVAGFLISGLLAPTYEATALVTVSQERFEIQFDPRFRTVDEAQQATRAYPELATSDQVLQALLDEAKNNGYGASLEDVAGVRRIVLATLGNDPSLLRLQIKGEDPQEVAWLANTWAGIFTEEVHQVYGTQTEAQLSFLTGQLAQTEAELKTAEEALISAKSADRVSILNNQLNVLTQTHAANLAEQSRVEQLVQDVARLQAQVSEGDGPPGLADEVTALLLQMKAYHADDSALQLQLDGRAMAEYSPAQQAARLAGLQQALAAQAGQLQREVTTLEEEILQVQEAYQSALVEQARLQRAHRLAESTYMTVASKVEEARIAAQDTTRAARVASQAVPPSEPSGPRRLLLGLVAGIFGAALGLLLLLLRTIQQRAAA